MEWDRSDCNRIPVSTPFAPGMTLSIEPGVYLGDMEGINPAFRNISVRIEDNVLITEHGPMLMSKLLPRTPEEIEQCMAQPASVTDLTHPKRFDLVENLQGLSDQFHRERRAMEHTGPLVQSVFSATAAAGIESTDCSVSVDSSPSLPVSLDDGDQCLLTTREEQSPHPSSMAVTAESGRTPVMSITATTSPLSTRMVDCSSSSSESASTMSATSVSSADTGGMFGPRKKIQRVSVVHSPQATFAPFMSACGVGNTEGSASPLQPFRPAGLFPFGGSLESMDFARTTMAAPLLNGGCETPVNAAADSTVNTGSIAAAPLTKATKEPAGKYEVISLLSDDSDDGEDADASVTLTNTTAANARQLTGSKRHFSEISCDVGNNLAVPTAAAVSSVTTSETVSAPLLFCTRKPKLTKTTSLFADTIGGGCEPGAKFGQSPMYHSSGQVQCDTPLSATDATEPASATESGVVSNSTVSAAPFEHRLPE